MKLKCVSGVSAYVTNGKLYDILYEDAGGDYTIESDCGVTMTVLRRNLQLLINAGVTFQLWSDYVATPEEACSQYADKPATPQRTKDALQVAAIRSIQEQCSKANLSISIDPEGFNVFDCDNDLQVMVHSVADVLEILESKLKFKSDMEKYQWM